MIQHQTQRLILSPQIRQYLRLLQLPLMELQQAVETELTENPILEESQSEKGEEEVTPESPSKIEPSTEEVRLGDSFDHLSELDENFQESYDYPDLSGKDPVDLIKQRNFQETLITKPEVLSDYLLWQIRFLDLTDAEKRIAHQIIGNIDEDGYLKAATEEIMQGCGASAAEVERVLAEIHELEPPGIGARNLQEALILQLRKKGAEARLALKIVADHLDLLQKRDWHQLSKVLSVGIEEVKRASAMIARLEPRPGRTFYVEEPVAVVPDAQVNYSEDDDGTLKVEINNETVPELRINPYYRWLLRNKATDEKTKVFLREKMQAAVNFMKALNLRKSTIREITEEIVKAQPEFFEKGFSHLRPLRLKDIAHRLGVHESTISRALHGKYVSTPQGTIPYKSFFSTKLETTNGEAESQKSIMEKIRGLIEKEDTRRSLSDEEIVQFLRADGIMIARRTVSKYRDLLKILPSHLRRNR